MKKFFLFVAALSVCALAADGGLDERVDGLAAQVERVMSKAGIHINGEFRAQFLNSAVDGDATAESGKKTESAEYTSVDFDIVARPNTAFSARAMFRLHQDWRNFFSDVQNPITSRWLSIDGTTANGVFKYNAGDYRKKLTPLTLWSPDLEMLYEPEIFAQGRQLAMSEAFLGGNNRVLQGANIELRAELGTESGGTVLKELNADIFGARLATRGTGESDPIGPGVGDLINGGYWDALYDKYLVGVNLGTQIIKGAGLGVANISIFDHVDSYRGAASGADGNLQLRGSAFGDTAKYHSTSNNIFSGRVNFDNSAFMDDEFVRFGINAEAAFSSYGYHSAYDTLRLRNAANTADSTVLIVGDRSIDGMALNAGLSVNFNFNETNSIGISADYIMNDSAFLNEAAQSPSFLQRAILNNENSLSGLGLLNPFDAMYRSVFKYTPSQYFAESRPYAKNAYTNVIFTKGGIDALGARGRDSVFSVFQAALPGGQASADRVGPVVKLDGSFLDKAISVGARVAMLKSETETPGGGLTWADTTDVAVNEDDGSYIYITNALLTTPYSALTNEFQEIVGGASIDIAKFAPAVGPSLVLGGSYGMHSAKYGGRASNESALLSAFLNYNFFTKFSLLAGFQQLGMSVKRWGYISEERTTVSGIVTRSVKVGGEITDEYVFQNIAVGFCYKAADGGALTVKVTRLSGEGPTKRKVEEANAEEFRVTTKTVTETKSYSALQPEVYLTVRF
jgi:hypothetical protein